MISTGLKKPIFLWCLANVFFAYQFILRVSAGILREEIIQRFAIDAGSFGVLAGYYYLGYSCSQIPFGIMLDRTSFRLITSIAIFTTAIGTILYATTDNWSAFLFARFLVGTGSGIAFLSIAKITKLFFNEKYHSLMLGFSFTFGLTGAVFGVTPMKFLFNYFGFSKTFKILAFVAIILSMAMLTFGKIERKQNNQSLNDVIKSVVNLITNPKILLIGVCGGLMVGALEGFGDVWAIPFFSQYYGMSESESNNVTSCVYIGMCFGGPILALIACVLRSTNFMIFLTGILMVSVFMILFYVEPLSPLSSAALMFFLGILCCYQVLVFSVASSYVEQESVGLAVAVINCINMSFGHFFHYIIGNNFEQNWDGKVNSLGHALYSSDNFIHSLSVIPLYCFIGQLGFMFLAISNKPFIQKYFKRKIS